MPACIFTSMDGHRAPCRQGVAESKAEARCWGPMHQGPFLQNLGIAKRLEALLAAVTDPSQQEALYKGAMRLVTGPYALAPPLHESSSDAIAGDCCQDGDHQREAQAGISTAETRTKDAQKLHEGDGAGSGKCGVHGRQESGNAEEIDCLAGVQQTGEQKHGDEAEDGMGFQYMVMAVTPLQQPPPFPFMDDVRK